MKKKKKKKKQKDYHYDKGACGAEPPSYSCGDAVATGAAAFDGLAHDSLIS
jgi:hypothetical protein